MMASESESASTGGRNSLLTFGIEMEFVVAWLDEDQADPHLEDKRSIYIGTSHPENMPWMSEGEIDDKVGEWEDQAEMIERVMGAKLGKPAEQIRSGLEGVRDHLRSRHSRPPYNRDPNEPPANQNIRHRIAKFLREHKIPAISDSNDDETWQTASDNLRAAKERLGREGNDEPLPGLRYVVWDVNTDESVGEGLTKEYHWAAVEITSPILYFCPESLELVRYVVNLLQSEYRILVNSSMMFHVHVGRGAKGFSFRELQAVIAFLYAATPRLDQLHPIWCGPLTPWAQGPRPHSLMANLDKKGIKKARRRKKAAGPENSQLTTEIDVDDDTKDNRISRVPIPYYQPIVTGKAHPLLQQWLGHQRANAFGVARIWNTRTLDELYSCLSTVYLDEKKHSYMFRPAYNLRNLVIEPVVKKTIEFRQHAGTMSPDAIVNWISVAAGVCSFIVNTPFHEGVKPVMQKLEHLDPNSATSWEMVAAFPASQESLRVVVNATSLLYGQPGDPYSVYDLLRDAGLAPQAEYYHKLGLHPFPPDFFFLRHIEAEDYGIAFASDGEDDSDGDESEEQGKE